VDFCIDSWDYDTMESVKVEDLVKALQELGVIPANTEETSSFHRSITGFLADRGFSVSKILDVEQETREGGYCETCWYSEVTVDITFEDGNGEWTCYTYYGDMGALIRELTN
jgi:predicted nucleic-acid-binding Zn-ribbon protein